ncbi:QcrA and Rieske domain-containing protein [Rhodocaloribacter sp.]
MDRRGFIIRLERLSLGALCGGAVLSGGCAGVAYVQAIRVKNRLVLRKADLAEHTGVLVELPGAERPIYLHRRGPDAYVAVWTRCTHRGCEVEPAGDRLVCPCHGSEYTLSGVVVKAPAERDLRQYPVTTDDEHVYIEL